MPPKLQANSETIVHVVVRGGLTATSVLAPKVGPLGISPAKLGDEINKLTKEYWNLKVPVQITIKGRDFTVEVQPSVPNLIIRALKNPRKIGGGRHEGDISLDDLILIARVVRPRSLAATLEGTLREVIGSAKSIVGITANGGMDPLDLLKAITAGEIEIPKE